MSLMCVCVREQISEIIVHCAQFFVELWVLAMARSSAGGVAMRYVLPLMTSRTHVRT